MVMIHAYRVVDYIKSVSTCSAVVLENISKIISNRSTTTLIFIFILQVNNTHILYEYSVWHDPRDLNAAINRWRPARVCYTCVMARDAELHTDVIYPQITIEHYEIAGVTGTFSIDLTLWDSTGIELDDEAEVDVGDKVTVKADMNGVDSSDDTLVLTVSL